MVDWYGFAEEFQTSSFSTKIDGKVFCFLYLGDKFCCLPFRFTGLKCSQVYTYYIAGSSHPGSNDGLSINTLDDESDTSNDDSSNEKSSGNQSYSNEQ